MKEVRSIPRAVLVSILGYPVWYCTDKKFIPDNVTIEIQEVKSLTVKETGVSVLYDDKHEEIRTSEMMIMYEDIPI